MKHRKKHRRSAAILGWIAAGIHLATAAQSAPVWRCGNVYSDQPCQGGRSIDVDDSRSDGQRRASEGHARDARRQADAMARERRRLEAQAAGQRPAVIALPERTAPVPAKPVWHKPRKPRKSAGTDDFTARAPAAATGKKHTRRASDE
ncbi:MAG: hypothetical protein QM586_08195 [Xenophilus sp.]